ncbi:hypothetical protein ACTXL6_08275 [Brachybacterium tyrofermentans]|uniref:hypothetical protein n=1 Tax=Brachybacterium tyrofermentans TaxID=47848 RepID=UPI003FD3187A
MPTLTMQAIADLAQVQREVVSMWRSRYADSPHPFPPPVEADGRLFEADLVADWLRVTGRGNNPDAPLEAVLHSSLFDSLLEDLDAASTLLLLHDQLGGPLADLRLHEVLDGARDAGLDRLIDSAQLPDLLARSQLVAAIDDLAEAAFSGRHVLERLVDTFTTPRGAWAGEALTGPGADLVADVVLAMHEQSNHRLDPHGSGGRLLITIAAAAAGEDRGLLVGIDDAMIQEPTGRALLRLLATQLGPDSVVDTACADEMAQGHLTLVMSQEIEDAHTFFEEIDSLLLERGPGDVLALIGPAELLVEPLKDDAFRVARERLLMPTAGLPADLRYVARLPRGLSRHGGRRRLALWVVGTAVTHADRTWTVYGEHADTALDRASRAAIAADVVAALAGGDALTSHAFLRSSRLATDALVRRRSLVLAPQEALERSGGESLARIWELDDGLVRDAVHLEAVDAGGIDPTVSWHTVTTAFAAEMRGTRLPEEAIAGPEPGSAIVIGPEEVRDPQRRGRRAIDRLVLEKATSRSTFTQPGDVVFTAEGGVAAFVDVEGGHVLQSPVRALRCRPDGRQGRILHPSVVAADISRQEGRDRRTWRLRTIPDDAVPAIEQTTARLEARRTHLISQLATLDALEDELTRALATGTLAAAPIPPLKEN